MIFFQNFKWSYYSSLKLRRNILVGFHALHQIFFFVLNMAPSQETAFALPPLPGQLFIKKRTTINWRGVDGLISHLAPLTTKLQWSLQLTTFIYPSSFPRGSHLDGSDTITSSPPGRQAGLHLKASLVVLSVPGSIVGKMRVVVGLFLPRSVGDVGKVAPSGNQRSSWVAKPSSSLALLLCRFLSFVDRLRGSVMEGGVVETSARLGRLLLCTGPSYHSHPCPSSLRSSSSPPLFRWGTA